MPMPPTPESEAIDAFATAMLSKMDALIEAVHDIHEHLDEVAAEATAQHAAAAGALVETKAHTDRLAVATEAVAHQPSGTANARYHQRKKKGLSMVNMKQDNDGTACAPCPPEAYPYGLRICLNDDACEKLGISGPVKAGTKLSVRAITTVVMCREELEPDDPAAKSEIYLDLQITDMEIAAPNSIYPNSMMKD